MKKYGKNWWIKSYKKCYENEKLLQKRKKILREGNSYDHEKINENETLQNEKKNVMKTNAKIKDEKKCYKKFYKIKVMRK